MRPVPSAACAAAIAVRRRRRRRLADLHMDDAAARRLDARRRRHHVHDHERRHIAAARTGISSRFAASSIVFSAIRGARARPAVAVFAGLLASAMPCRDPVVIARCVDRPRAASLGSRAFRLRSQIGMTENGTPIRARRTAPAARAVALRHGACARLPPAAAAPRRRARRTAPRGMPIIRDAEIEQLLRDYTAADPARGRPCQAERAGRHHQRPLVQRLRHGRPPHLHQCRRADRREDAERDHRRARARNRPHRRRPSVAAARAAGERADRIDHRACCSASARWSRGARAGNVGGNVGAAAIMAPQAAIQRSLLAYVRTQEDQADHAGVKFLNATGQSPRAWSTLFKRLANEVLFNARYIDPYMQIASDAGRTRRRAGEPAPRRARIGTSKDPPELQLRHDLMRAKLSGFLERPDTVARRYPLERPRACRRAMPAPSRPTVTATCARRCAQIDGLIQAQPQQSLFPRAQGPGAARRRPARPKPIAPLRRAVALSHRTPALIQIMLAQALIATNDPQGRRRGGRAACAPRSRASRKRRMPTRSSPWPMAARATSRNADLASAQAAFSRGDIKTARQLAARAKTRFPIGSPAWVQGRRYRQLSNRPTPCRDPMSLTRTGLTT